jgi:hypothetical protein
MPRGFTAKLGRNSDPHKFRPVGRIKSLSELPTAAVKFVFRVVGCDGYDPCRKPRASPVRHSPRQPRSSLLRKALQVRWQKYLRLRGSCNMSKWQEENEIRNRHSIARLTRALPGILPSNLLSRALNHLFVSPTPRLAIDSYWRAHPIRADRLARSLATRSGAPHGWAWRLGNDRTIGLPTTFRSPRRRPCSM